MRRGTTPTITISVTGSQLSEFYDIWVTFFQPYVWSLTKKYSDNDLIVDTTNNKIYVNLSQLDTSYFRAGRDETIQIQVKARKSDGKVNASPIKTIPVEEILNEEVMGNG